MQQKYAKIIRKKKNVIICGTISLKSETSLQHPAGPSIGSRRHYRCKHVAQYWAHPHCFFRMLLCTCVQILSNTTTCCSPREMIMQKAPPVTKANEQRLAFFIAFESRLGANRATCARPVGAAQRTSTAKCSVSPLRPAVERICLDDTYDSKHYGIEDLGQQARGGMWGIGQWCIYTSGNSLRLQILVTIDG